MKKLYLIGGTMGVGKTTVCRKLKKELPDCVFLDGDWCWDMDPFKVTGETKQMVTDNICFLLNNFIKCSEFKNIVFCWVMHEQSIIDGILGRLNLSECTALPISLVCSKEALTARLEKDIAAGIRDKDIILRSASRIDMYGKLDMVKIDVSKLTVEETAKEIIRTADMFDAKNNI